MRMGTSAESHVGFVYQKIPKQRQKPTEAQQRHQQQREFPRTKQKLVAPVIADSANAAAECSGEDNKQIQRKQLQLQLVLLQRQLQELQQHQQQRRHPSKLQKQRQQLLRALEVTKEETLQVLQLMLHHQQQGLLLQQQLQLVALVQQEQGERGVSQAKLIEGAARLLEQQHLQEHQELVQKLSMQYWEESWRQQTLLKEATAAVAVQRLPAAPVGRSSALGSKVQQVRQELREKQKQLQNLEVMQLQDEQGQRKLEQHQRHDAEGMWLNKWMCYCCRIAAAGRLQQMAQIFAAAVSMLPHPVSSQKEAIAARQQQKMPCCCSGCCYPVYRGNNEQPAAAAARVELMSAAHPQQQLLLLRRIFSAFQVDQLLERGSLMQEQQQQAITAARAEALLVHFRDVSVQGSDIDARTTPAGTAAGKENAAINMPYQCPCRQQNRCIGLSSGATNNSSNCTVCICGAAAALADLLPSIPCSRGYGVELQFCCQGQQQLQKRLCRPIRRHGPSADSTTAASTTAPVTKMPSGRLPTKYDSDARSRGGAGCDTSSSVVVILPCLSPLCSACCYGDSLLLQLLRCSFPLAVQQQLLQQEVVMQQRMPLITVIDKQEQQQLEQKCMQDWKEAKMANLDLSAVPVAGAQANIRRGMVECPLEDTFDALQLLQQQLQQDHSQPMQVQHELGYGVTSETNCLEAAFRRHFEKLLEVQRHKMHLRGPARLRDQGQAPESVGHSDEEDEAIRQKRINLSVVVSPTSCKQERAGTPFQRQSKRPRRSKTLPGLSESLHVVADAALPTIGDGSTASAGSDFSSACCNEARVPVTISDDADGSKATVAIRLHPHEAQLLRACAVAAVKPTKFSCKRALQLLMQQRRLLQQHQSEGDKVEYVSPRTAGRDERRWVPNTASSLQLMSSNATWSAFSDSDCCSTHSSRSTCTSRSGKGTAGRRSALIAVAEEQLQQVRRHLVETQTALRQQLLLKLLQRDFSDHRVTNASSMEKGTVPVASSSCSCSPQLHLEQQEVLFKGGKGSCMWWRQYYMLLGELAVLKEKALYKAIDICLQEQQSPVSQALRGTQQQVQQQQLQRPREEQVKGTSVSANKTLVADGDEPNILKTSGMGCRLSDPLLQSPLAPRKRRSQGGF
ncbi:LOW QUALITY PROTEIN: uncharacterized protein EMH_0069230 [Eimeria mitis]|uniref:Uncharacterized protein n=1 Tax=Eimeria mitis TaxID=44415 RepID=U6KDT4_9EIME|nr:LOW QUALITY PROTEIN: uncharacterized protein EMH_0069230 [Eimeria mitis]CDJ36195.1 hypothetical protein, conserved [Eimeria mitis]